MGCKNSELRPCSLFFHPSRLRQVCQKSCQSLEFGAIGKAGKTAEKAYAWAYLKNVFPSVSFTGYFDEASEALEIYSKYWQQLLLESASSKKGTESDLAIKLRKAMNLKSSK